MHGTLDFMPRAKGEHESIFINTFSASRGPGELCLASALMGEIRPFDLSAHGLIMQANAFLASDLSVNLDAKWQGLKGFTTEKGCKMMRATGPGMAWLASCGAIVEKELKLGETVTVDAGHVLAFPDTMQFNVRKVANWTAPSTGGEGVVVDFYGPGRVGIQTRSPAGTAETLK